MGTKSRKILFIQHANGLGGSAMSLLYTMRGLDRKRFNPVVALARPVTDLEILYKNDGIETIPWPGMTLLDHSTVAPMPLYHPKTVMRLVQLGLNWRKTQKRTVKLLEFIRPDIVHLNSMPLFPCADILNHIGFPYVWHVREPPFNQGLRTKLIRRIMLKAPALIFISKADQQEWVQGRRGRVIHNFIDTGDFHPDVDGSEVKKIYQIPERTKVILYLGKANPVKGVFPLMKALGRVTKLEPNIVCLMPGFDTKIPNTLPQKITSFVYPMFGKGTEVQRIESLIREHELKPYLRAAPFQNDIRKFIAASDVVVFPAIRPHFARPVIEAAAMGKPSISSNLNGIRELVRDNETGILVTPGDSNSLASAILHVIHDENFARRLGNRGREFALEMFSMKRQIPKIEETYQELLHGS